MIDESHGVEPLAQMSARPSGGERITDLLDHGGDVESVEAVEVECSLVVVQRELVRPRILPPRMRLDIATHAAQRVAHVRSIERDDAAQSPAMPASMTTTGAPDRTSGSGCTVRTASAFQQIRSHVGRAPLGLLTPPCSDARVVA